jgi:flagellar M-ring protein FliF
LNNYLSLIANDFKKLWVGLDFLQKLAIIVLVLGTIAAMSYFIAKSTEPTWSVLYSDLQETDALAVTANLKKGGYQYKMSDDKKSILVPSEMKEELRIQVAQSDLIHDSNPGFELLDKMQLGATDFQNKLTRQRIFQGELTRTIEKISGVAKVRVQIAEPERSVFSDKDEEASASVMLILEPGAQLKSDQVKAIKNLVAYSIPRLKPEKVFVADQEGNVLSDDLNKNSSDIESYKSNFEKNASKKITKVLEKIVGYNNVSVEVSADLNFNSTKSTIETYVPLDGTSDGILNSSQVETETYDKGKDTAPGVKPTPAAGNKAPNYEKKKVFNNYNVSKEIKQVIYAPGSVQRMTIAVAVNKILTTAEKEELKNLVTSAAGANIQRGDTITITSMQFASVEEDQKNSQEMMTALKQESQVDFWFTKVGPLVVILILGLSALFIIKALISRPLEGEEVDGINQFASEDDELDQLESESQRLLESANIPVIEARLDPELERMKKELNSMILSNPSEASRLLLSYIKD